MERFFNGRKYFFVISFLSLFCFCDKPKQNPEPGCLIPFQEGNYWIYSNKYSRTSQGDSLFSVEPVTFTLKFSREINHVKWYSFFPFLKDVVSCNNGSVRYMLVENDNDITADSSFLFFKYPTKMKEQWLNRRDNETMVTISLNKKVDVPAGSFNCIFYQNQSMVNKHPDYGYYVATGVGLVKYTIMQTTKLGNGEIDTIWNHFELVQYKINKKN